MPHLNRSPSPGLAAPLRHGPGCLLTGSPSCRRPGPSCLPCCPGCLEAGDFMALPPLALCSLPYPQMLCSPSCDRSSLLGHQDANLVLVLRVNTWWQQCSLCDFDIATRKFKITYVACSIFLMHSSSLCCVSGEILSETYVIVIRMSLRIIQMPHS